MLATTMASLPSPTSSSSPNSGPGSVFAPPHRRTVGPAQFTTITTATVYAATVFLPEWLPRHCQCLTVRADYNPWVPGDFEFYWFVAMPRGFGSSSESRSTWCWRRSMKKQSADLLARCHRFLQRGRRVGAAPLSGWVAGCFRRRLGKKV